MTPKICMAIAAVLGATGVALGAFGAHGLRSMADAKMLEIWETAARYQQIHAVALLGVALWMERHPSGLANASAIAMAVGVLIFSGTLYVLVLTGMRWLGAITPLGGTALIVAWVLLAVAALKS
ncbi:MAG: DUF423 domain-containing protein [Deltaproteobacteria bacterium]|nr:DUF423 domain-containing protein [Deltaproteobacteria bacterium]